MNLELFNGIDAFLFDLGGVIIDVNVKRTVDAFRALGFEDVDNLIAQCHHGGVFKAFERGDISERQFLNALKQEVKSPVTEEALVEAWNFMLGDFPTERVRILEKLHQSYPTYILSNTNGIHHQQFRHMAGGYDDIAQLFTDVFYSFRLGCSKPEKKIFEKVIDKSGLNARTTLFLDDSEINLQVAAELGFKTQLVSRQNPIEKIFA